MDMNKNVIVGIIAVTIAIIVIATVALPIIGDMEDEVKDVTVPTSDLRYGVVEEDGAIHTTIEIDGTTIKVGDTTIQNATGTILWFTDMQTAYLSASGTVALVGGTGSTSLPGVTKVDINGNTVAVTATASQTLQNGNMLLALDPEGSYALWNGTDNPKANTGATVYAVGYSSSLGYLASGTLSASSTPQSLTAVEGNQAATVAFTLADEVYTLDADSVAFGSTSVTYKGVIAPIELNSELTDSTMSTLISVIPILLILSVVVGAVAMIAYRS